MGITARNEFFKSSNLSPIIQKMPLSPIKKSFRKLCTWTTMNKNSVMIMMLNDSNEDRRATYTSSIRKTTPKKKN